MLPTNWKLGCNISYDGCLLFYCGSTLCQPSTQLYNGPLLGSMNFKALQHSFKSITLPGYSLASHSFTFIGLRLTVDRPHVPFYLLEHLNSSLHWTILHACLQACTTFLKALANGMLVRYEDSIATTSTWFAARRLYQHSWYPIAPKPIPDGLCLTTASNIWEVWVISQEHAEAHNLFSWSQSTTFVNCMSW